jgi:hypothetical protein
MKAPGDLLPCRAMVHKKAGYLEGYVLVERATVFLKAFVEECQRHYESYLLKNQPLMPC